MNLQDIIRMASEVGMRPNMTEALISELVHFAALVSANALIEPCCCNYDQCQKVCMPRAAAAERGKIAAWMIDRSYATGHGDTTEDMLKELEWQIRESEREACARIAWNYEPDESGPIETAIRARGDK